MKRLPLLVASLLMPFTTASAQKTIIGLSGAIMRYHGDTIWMERDSSVQRSVTHGDTVEHTSSVNGAPVRTTRYLVQGDSAWLLVQSANGSPTLGRHVPIGTATSLNRMLEVEVRGAETQARLESFPILSERDSSTGRPRSYAVAPDVHMMKIRDTVWYVRGCPDRHTDTTVFLLFGADSVKRLSAPQRMFGQAMALSLTSKLRMAALQQITAQLQPALPADLPKMPGGCSK